MKRVVTHHSLGDITVSQTSRARRISLSVRPPDRVRLSIPNHVSLSEAMRFVDSKQEWVLGALSRYAAMPTPETISMPYSTRSHSLALNPCDCSDIKTRVAQGVIRIDYPLESHYADSDIQLAIKNGIEQAWRIEAKQLLPELTEQVATRLGLRYRSVTVRNTVSKWGSCSGRDDLSLSLHLMRLPDHLIEYIVVHELCHTVHKNHGPKFHALLDSYTNGNHKVLRKELKVHHPLW